MSKFIADCIKYGVPPWGASLSGGGGGGNVATDTIFDVKGDLAVGTGANTAAKLPAGTNGQVLIVDSSQPTGLKWGAAPAGTPASSVVSEVTFGQAASVGTSTNFARQDHTHGTPTNPVIAHEADADPHTQYQRESEKDATGGYAGLTGYSINFKNAANTFTSFLANANTAARTYTFPNASGTVALTSDITKTAVGLGNVDNTADSVKSVANAVEWNGAALTISNLAPSGGADGDIWFQYT